MNKAVRQEPLTSIGHGVSVGAGPGPVRDRRYRVLFVCSHVVQYASPLFRAMAKHPQLDILVAYCTLQGAQPVRDPGFSGAIAWDVPLLDGYPWVLVPSRLMSPMRGSGAKYPLFSSFFRFVNPGLWSLVRKHGFDAIVVYGYAYLSYWIAILAAKFGGVPLILPSDAVELDRDGIKWKIPVKKLLLPRVYGMADAVCAPSTASIDFYCSLGIPREKIFLTHNTVDNEYFKRASKEAPRDAIRAGWDVSMGARVVLFCGKLYPDKRPQDLLRAFACAAIPETILVFAGDGPSRSALESEARALGIADRVRFLGFVNQSQLPGVYAASDLLCLTSLHEAFGLVVNEAMCCGLPAVVSDHVGARLDLIKDNETGFVYSVGNVEALANILRKVLPDGERLRRMGEAARRRIEGWSYREHVEGLMSALKFLVTPKSKGR